MKRLFILLLAFMPVITFGQNMSKVEKKAYKDSIRRVKAEERRITDSLYWAQQAEEEARMYDEWSKRKATSLVIVTSFESQKDVFDMLVHRMINDGTVPALIDKDYFIIRTARKQISVGTYDITYTVFKKNGKVCVRGAGVGYGSLRFGYGMGIQSEKEMIVPLEYGGTINSTAGTAWSEIKKYLLSITHEDVIYELPE